MVNWSIIKSGGPGLSVQKIYGRVSPGVPYKIPHYKREEYEIAIRWLMYHAPNGKISFDWRLPVRHVPSEIRGDPKLEAAWLHLKQERIDAVVETDEEIILVEIKDVVRKSAIGQLLHYKRRFEEEYKPDKPIKLMIVAGEDDPEVRKTAEEEGIEVVVLGIPSRRKRILGF